MSTALQSRHTLEIPELIWATGAISYEYHFADRALFDTVVQTSWHMRGSLFSADATTIVKEGEHLAGIELGMPGNEFRTRQRGLTKVWRLIAENGETDTAQLAGVLERSEVASWLNPVIHEDTYYIHAISVKPEYKGQRVGYLLMHNAITVARNKGFAKLQLDVLSDNPAVGFYQSVGFDVLAETRAPKPTAFGIPPEYRMGMVL